jgi:hypothetical protein
MRFRTASLAAALAALLAGPLHADIWDIGTETDNGNTTDNTAVHGLEQQHDLAALPGPVADEDWFRVCSTEGHSYEAIVDGLTGDVSENGSLKLDLVASDGSVVQPGTSQGVGDQNLDQTFYGNSSGPVECGTYWLRVSGADCGTTCGANDRYRIRFYETTIAVPRFNNASGQVTVLIIQNPTDYTTMGTVDLWDSAGGLVTSFGFNPLNPKASVVTNLATVNGGVANGLGGTITIHHFAGYGALAVKAVALEPATGFSFDTPGLYRPH